MPTLLSYAELLVGGDQGQNISGLLPAAVDLPIHTPMMITGVDATSGTKTFAVADGRVDGFLTRAVAQTRGSGLDYLLFGTVTPTGQNDGVYETPFVAGELGSITGALLAEFEGADYLKVDAGTGQLTSATAAGTELTAKSGKFLAAQAGETVTHVVVGNLSANPKTAGNVRLQIKKVESYVKPAA